ncbi:MAG: hypothetical protein AB6733_21310 [Clostridiaceae bacterium]
MGYNIIDIINKGIDIAKKRKDIYLSIGNQEKTMAPMKVMSLVLAKEIDKTIEFYEEIKKEVISTEFEEIDFSIYDKISFLINEFNSRIFVHEIKNNKEFLKLSLSLEKDVHSLLLSIQGRLVKSTNDINSKTYMILSKIIKFKENHIKTLEKIIK